MKYVVCFVIGVIASIVGSYVLPSERKSLGIPHHHQPTLSFDAASLQRATEEQELGSNRSTSSDHDPFASHAQSAEETPSASAEATPRQITLEQATDEHLLRVFAQAESTPVLSGSTSASDDSAPSSSRSLNPRSFRPRDEVDATFARRASVPDALVKIAPSRPTPRGSLPTSELMSLNSESTPLKPADGYWARVKKPLVYYVVLLALGLCHGGVNSYVSQGATNKHFYEAPSIEWEIGAVANVIELLVALVGPLYLGAFTSMNRNCRTWFGWPFALAVLSAGQMAGEVVPFSGAVRNGAVNMWVIPMAVWYAWQGGRCACMSRSQHSA